MPKPKQCKHNATTYAKLRDGTAILSCVRCGKRFDTLKGVEVK